MTEQRLQDLVRYARSYLHENDLITDDEYAKLASIEGSPARLRSYDSMQAEITTLKAAIEVARKGDHAPVCLYSQIREKPCTCWKAEMEAVLDRASTKR